MLCYISFMQMEFPCYEAAVKEYITEYLIC